MIKWSSDSFLIILRHLHLGGKKYLEREKQPIYPKGCVELDSPQKLPSPLFCKQLVRFTLFNGRLAGTVFAVAQEVDTWIVFIFGGIRTHKGENVSKIDIAREGKSQNWQ